MPKKRRVLRDPLKDVPLDQITPPPPRHPFCLRLWSLFCFRLLRITRQRSVAYCATRSRIPGNSGSFLCTLVVVIFVIFGKSFIT